MSAPSDGARADARKARAAAASAEALADVLGDIRVAGARQADWWTNDTEHSLLIKVLRGECVPWAEGLLASDWLAGVIADAKAEALRDAADSLEGGLGVFGIPQTLYDTRVWLRARAGTHRADGKPMSTELSYPVVTPAGFPYGVRCMDCDRDLLIGDPYTDRAHSMCGNDMVTEIVCVYCANSDAK